MTKKKEFPMAKKPIFKRIGEKLTADEREKIGDALSKARLDHSELLEEKHVYDKKKNEELNVLDDSIQRLAESWHDKKRYTDVECRAEYDDKKFEVTYYRLDTGAKVVTEPMDEDQRLEAEARNAHREKNPELPFDKPASGKKAKLQPPESVVHKGQKLSLVKGGKKGKKSKGTEARP